MFFIVQAVFLAILLVLPTLFFKFLFEKFKLPLGRLEKDFLCLFLGQLLFVSFSFILALLIGLSVESITIALVPFLVFDLWFLKLEKFSKFLVWKFEAYEKIFLLILLAFAVFLFLLLERHMLATTPDGFSTPHNTFGDLQYHLAIINSFFPGENFPPQNPIYSGVRLSYPFLIDFNTAILRVLGFSLQNALIIPGLIFGECFFAFFLLFSYRFLRNVKGSILSLLMFAFNGGLGGYLVFRESFLSNNFFEALPEKFTSTIDQYNFRFPNAVSSVFMAERPILVGMAAFFAILILLWIAFDKKNAFKELLLAGFIIGLLPLWHTHTLIALGLVLPFYFLAYWIYNRTSFLNSLKFILPISYLSIPLGILGMLWHIPQVMNGGVHFFGLKVGWIVGAEGFWNFWFVNLGIFPVLLLLAFFLLDKKQKLFYLPLITILIAANLINFQPFNWDNYKILLVWFAVSSTLTSALFMFLLSKGKVLKTFAVVTVLFLILNGSVLIVGDYLSFYGLFTKEDIELANWEVRNTRPSDLFLTGPQHNQFSILAGRKILMGYQGYLWTQGIDSGSREKDIQKMYHGDVDLIKSYKVDYIVLGYKERESYLPDENFLNRNFPLVYKAKDFKIYKVVW